MLFPLALLLSTVMLSTTATPVSEARAAPPDYVLVEGHGYYWYSHYFDWWPQAKATCEEDGAYLHILNSVEERDALYARFKYINAWVGVHRVNTTSDEDFRTIFGDTLESTGFTEWDTGYPSGTAGTEPYVYSCVDYGLRTLRLSVGPLYFICEYDL